MNTMAASPPFPVITGPLQSQLEKELDEAIGQLDNDLKRELITAMEVVPNLVKTETDRIKFLRRESFDVARAAHRLAVYWKYRKQVFQSRWLLPMSMTGSGTLTMNAIKVLQSGFVHLVSSPSSVCILDTSRLPRPLQGEMLPASFFYLGTTACNEEAQTKGITILHIVSGHGPQDTSMDHLVWNIIHHALPFHVKDIVILPIYLQPGKEHLVDYLTYQTTRLVQFRSQRQCAVLRAVTPSDAKNVLEQSGLPIEVLPKRFGGDLDDSAFQNWIQRRLQWEHSVSSSSMSTTRDYTPRGSTSVLVKRKLSSGDEGNDESAEKEFVRKRNALYARRMYHKKKLDLIALPEQKKTLQSQNETLRRENHRLITLLREAESLVAASSQQCGPASSLQSGHRQPSETVNQELVLGMVHGGPWMSQPMYQSNDTPSTHEREEQATRQLERVDSSSHMFDCFFDIKPQV